MDLNAKPDGLKIPEKFGIPAELHDDCIQQTWNLLVKGVGDLEELTDSLMDDIPFVTEAAGNQIDLSDEDALELARFLRETRQRQLDAIPPEVIENNPLNLAFEELEDQGITARMDFTCCGTCGSTEIWSEIEDDSETKGYVFFHT